MEVRTWEMNMNVPSSPLRILIVDDVSDMAESMRVLLRAEGYTVATAPNAAEALAKTATFSPDVVLLDLGLPKIDGLEVARRIRKQTGKQPLLIAMTGWTRETDRHRAQAAGIDHYMNKPVDLDKLDRLLTSYKQKLES